MMAQMYSRKEFDLKLRTEFQLPADPYSSEDAVAYLKDLGVIYYRDQAHGEGVIIQPDDVEERIEDTGNFLTFYSEIELTPEGSPAPWRKASPEIISRNGDDKAWLLFNSHRIIQRFNSFSIHYA